MKTTRKRRGMWTPAVGVLAVLGSLVAAGCEPQPTEAQTKANQERWENFQKTNKQEVSNAMEAYEKRQKELADKKAGSSKPDAKATPAPKAAN